MQRPILSHFFLLILAAASSGCTGLFESHGTAPIEAGRISDGLSAVYRITAGKPVGAEISLLFHGPSMCTRADGQTIPCYSVHMNETFSTMEGRPAASVGFRSAGATYSFASDHAEFLSLYPDGNRTAPFGQLFWKMLEFPTQAGGLAIRNSPLLGFIPILHAQSSWATFVFDESSISIGPIAKRPSAVEVCHAWRLNRLCIVATDGDGPLPAAVEAEYLSSGEDERQILKWRFDLVTWSRGTGPVIAMQALSPPPWNLPEATVHAESWPGVPALPPILHVPPGTVPGLNYTDALQTTANRPQLAATLAGSAASYVGDWEFRKGLRDLVDARGNPVDLTGTIAGRWKFVFTTVGPGPSGEDPRIGVGTYEHRLAGQTIFEPPWSAATPYLPAENQTGPAASLYVSLQGILEHFSPVLDGLTPDYLRLQDWSAVMIPAIGTVWQIGVGCYERDGHEPTLLWVDAHTGAIRYGFVHGDTADPINRCSPGAIEAYSETANVLVAS